MREFAFELALAAHLEDTDSIVSRQLGTHVDGRRVVDLVRIDVGREFETRRNLTSEAIPSRAIESDVGPGRARYWADVFDCHPDRAETAIDRAVECGFFERERRNGRTYVRQTTRYPDWFDRIVGIENKPDLDRPGALETQLLTDVRLGLLDEVVLATASYVTGAHRNRIPEEVGIWRFDPETGEREVVREATQLPVDRPGVEILECHAGRTEVSIVSTAAIERARRRVAERAYGKGWRTFELPPCDRISPDDRSIPHCPWKGRTVRPATDCGPACDGFCSASPPAVDTDAIRAERTAWDRSPAGFARDQAGLDRFSTGDEDRTADSRLDTVE